MNVFESLPILAVESERLSIVVKGLAVVGAAVLGGFGTGAAVQGAARLLSGTRVPALPLQLIRVLAAVATGWIVFLLVAGPGGPGLGGGGGSGILPGGGEAGSTSDRKASASSGSTSASSASPSFDREATSINIHVLESALVQKKLGSEGVNKKKFFRVEGSESLVSLPELEKELMRLRKVDMPKLKHIGLLPEGDAASDSSPLITGLKQWGEQEGFMVDTSALGASRGSG